MGSCRKPALAGDDVLPQDMDGDSIDEVTGNRLSPLTGGRFKGRAGILLPEYEFPRFRTKAQSGERESEAGGRLRPC